jgi:hypothetical protein
MLQDIVAVKPKDDYTLHLVFEDGVSGDVQVSKLIHFTEL